MLWAVFHMIEGDRQSHRGDGIRYEPVRLIEEAIAAFLGPDERVVHDSASHGLRPDYDWTVAEGFAPRARTSCLVPAMHGNGSRVL